MTAEMRHLLFTTIDNLRAYHDRALVYEKLYEAFQSRYGNLDRREIGDYVMMLVDEYCGDRRR